MNGVLYKGVWQEEVRDDEGNITQERTKLRDAPVITENTDYTIDEQNKTLQYDGGDPYPIDDHSWELRKK